MIWVNVRINNVLNWFFGQLAYCHQHVVAAVRQSGIHYQSSLLPGLNDNVATRARQQIHIALHVHHLKLRTQAALRQ